MDYLSELEWKISSLQKRAMLLSELKSLLDTSSSVDLRQFAHELEQVSTRDGNSIANILRNLLISADNTIKTESVITKPAVTQFQEIKQTEKIVQVEEAKSNAEKMPLDIGSPAFIKNEGTLDKAIQKIEKNLKSIPGGTFIMGYNNGSDSEKPEHKVTVSGFSISAYLITNELYKFFILDNPMWAKDKINPELHDGNYLLDWSQDNYPENQDNYPVSHISFFAAEAFASWIGFRLPTEAEWEYACRGGLQGKKFPSGDTMNDKIANFAKQARSTTEVGKYPPNDYGLFDMAGNLFEWIKDWYGPYTQSEQTDPKGPSSGEYKIIRGGSFVSSAAAVRVSFRVDEEPNRAGFTGIRIAK